MYLALQLIVQADPDLVALHCQEIGGKDFESAMPGVKTFVKYVCYIDQPLSRLIHKYILINCWM